MSLRSEIIYEEFLFLIVLDHGDVKYTLSGRLWGKPDVKGASRFL
nr:MAG TPA: hypothetical protein [Bacteriophage sp.]